MDAVSTAGNVKLFVPPRQSRGNSYWGLGRTLDKPLGRKLDSAVIAGGAVCALGSASAGGHKGARESG